MERISLEHNEVLKKEKKRERNRQVIPTLGETPNRQPLVFLGRAEVSHTQANTHRRIAEACQ